ncbi:TonB family protein [Bartonella sp. B41]
MNLFNTERLLILWASSFICALLLHVMLVMQFYFQNIGVSKGAFSPTIMLTLTQEAVYLNSNEDFLNDNDMNLSNIDTVPETSNPDSLEQEFEVLEQAEEIQQKDSQHTEENGFVLSKPFEKPIPQNMEDKSFVKKQLPKPKTLAKRSNAKVMHSSSSATNWNAGVLESTLSEKWLAKIQEQLERQKKYAVGQRTGAAKGTAQLEFRVREQGNIFSSRIVRSTGNQELDKLAMEVLQRVGTFPPPPPSEVNKIIRVSLIFS